MGLFSGIKRAVKKVFKGVKKVFKKVGKFVGKIAGSKWGKALLIAAAVFTGGMALAAGISGFAGSTATTFMGKFVVGAKEFMAVLASPVQAAKNLAGGAPLTGAAAQGAAAGVPAAAEVAGGAADIAASVTPAAQLGTGTGAGVSAAAPGAGGGFLSKAAGVAGKAAKGAGEFLKSEGGGMLAGQVLKGYAQGAALEEQLKREDVRRGPLDEGQFSQILERAGNVQTPGGFLDRSRRFNERINRAQFPTQPGNPEDVYGSYVTGG